MTFEDICSMIQELHKVIIRATAWHRPMRGNIVYLGYCQSVTLHTELCTSLINSKALLHTLMHCISDSADCVTLYCPLYLHPCMCCLFVYLFVCLSLSFSITCCLPCLFISPFGLFLLLIGSRPTLSPTAPIV